MKKRTWKAWMIVLAVAVFVTALWGGTQFQSNRQTAALLENQYQNAFYNMYNSIENLNFALAKAQIAGKEQSLALLSQISSEAENAQNNLNGLPLDQTALIRTEKYFNQLADYSITLNKKVARDEELTEQEKKQIGSFYEELKDIYQAMSEMETAVASGDVMFTALKKRQGFSNASARTAVDSSQRTAEDYLVALNKKLSTIDTLIYEGAYSDHMLKLNAKGMEGLEAVTLAQAEQKALEFLKKCGHKNFEKVSGIKSDLASIPVYIFVFNDNDQKTNDQKPQVAVSQNGGYIISAFMPQKTGVANISLEEAAALAEAFLQKLDLGEMEIVKQYFDEYTVDFSFARIEEDILYYPDNVLVGVSLVDGEITAYQAKDYWTNYSQRELPEMMIEAKEMGEGLNKAFEPLGDSRLVMISDGAGKEILCHEFSGKCNDAEYIIQINSQKGFEENIFSHVKEGQGFYTR
ncbi:MAG: PepSY1/2 domain-containing protein [Bacillota bacterium]